MWLLVVVIWVGMGTETSAGFQSCIGDKDWDFGLAVWGNWLARGSFSFRADPGPCTGADAGANEGGVVVLGASDGYARLGAQIHRTAVEVQQTRRYDGMGAFNMVVTALFVAGGPIGGWGDGRAGWN